MQRTDVTGNTVYLENSPVNQNHSINPKNPVDKSVIWRCPYCRRILGVRVGDSIQIKDRRVLQLVAMVPVTRQCPRCKKMVSTKEVRLKI